MVYGIIQWVLISLILIILVHHLFSFFKDTLTVPKVKDLVNQPSESYKEIEKTLNESTININVAAEANTANTANTDNIDPIEMKTELKNFFDNLKQNKLDQDSTPNTKFNATPSSNIAANSFPQANNIDTNQYSAF